MMNIIELNKDELTSRWSKSLVKKYAPQPYRTAKNDYGGANICYYLVADIERIEQMPEFKQELKRINKQRASQLMPTPESDALF